MGLFNKDGINIGNEYLVTYQVTCRFRASDEKTAERMLDRAMSIGISMAPMIVGLGSQAVVATEANLRTAGLLPEKT